MHSRSKDTSIWCPLLALNRTGYLRSLWRAFGILLLTSSVMSHDRLSKDQIYQRELNESNDVTTASWIDFMERDAIENGTSNQSEYTTVSWIEFMERDVAGWYDQNNEDGEAKELYRFKRETSGSGVSPETTGSGMGSETTTDVPNSDTTATPIDETTSVNTSEEITVTSTTETGSGGDFSSESTMTDGTTTFSTTESPIETSESVSATTGVATETVTSPETDSGEDLTTTSFEGTMFSTAERSTTALDENATTTPVIEITMGDLTSPETDSGQDATTIEDTTFSTVELSTTATMDLITTTGTDMTAGTVTSPEIGSGDDETTTPFESTIFSTVELSTIATSDVNATTDATTVTVTSLKIDTTSFEDATLITAELTAATTAATLDPSATTNTDVSTGTVTSPEISTTGDATTTPFEETMVSTIEMLTVSTVATSTDATHSIVTTPAPTNVGPTSVAILLTSPESTTEATTRRDTTNPELNATTMVSTTQATEGVTSTAASGYTCRGSAKGSCPRNEYCVLVDDNHACQCNPGFTRSGGDSCEQGKIFGGSLHIDRSFNEDLNNKSSPLYIELVDIYVEFLRKAYKGETWFIGVIIIGFRNGSTIVDHEILSNQTNVNSSNVASAFGRFLRNDEHFANCSCNSRTCNYIEDGDVIPVLANDSCKDAGTNDAILCHSTNISQYCETQATCQASNGDISCACNSGNVFENGSSTSCTRIICSAGVGCNEPFGSCRVTQAIPQGVCDCDWGFQGEACDTVWLFVLVVCLSVLVFIGIVVAFAVWCRRRRGKNWDNPYDNTGVFTISLQKFKTMSDWDEKVGGVVPTGDGSPDMPVRSWRVTEIGNGDHSKIENQKVGNDAAEKGPCMPTSNLDDNHDVKVEQTKV